MLSPTFPIISKKMKKRNSKSISVSFLLYWVYRNTGKVSRMKLEIMDTTLRLEQAPQVVHVREHRIPSAYGIDTQFL